MDKLKTTKIIVELNIQGTYWVTKFSEVHTGKQLYMKVEVIGEYLTAGQAFIAANGIAYFLTDRYCEYEETVIIPKGLMSFVPLYLSD